jgi:hypothetical protein
MMKNERARAFPAFSHGPPSKQEVMSKMLQFISIKGRRLNLCTLYNSVGSSIERLNQPLVHVHVGFNNSTSRFAFPLKLFSLHFFKIIFKAVGW